MVCYGGFFTFLRFSSMVIQLPFLEMSKLHIFGKTRNVCRAQNSKRLFIALVAGVMASKNKIHKKNGHQGELLDP